MVLHNFRAVYGPWWPYHPSTPVLILSLHIVYPGHKFCTCPLYLYTCEFIDGTSFSNEVTALFDVRSVYPSLTKTHPYRHFRRTSYTQNSTWSLQLHFSSICYIYFPSRKRCHHRISSDFLIWPSISTPPTSSGIRRLKTTSPTF